jgi:plastocyanin
MSSACHRPLPARVYRPDVAPPWRSAEDVEMTNARRIGLVVASLLLLALPAAARAADTTVHITDAPSYDPIDVTVTVGGTVTWLNDHTFTHDAAALDGSWATPKLENGETATVTFDAVGSYEYLCTLHPLMRGTVAVVAAPPDTSTAPAGNHQGGPDVPVLLIAAVVGAMIAVGRFRTMTTQP